jgi:hypothetical protein
MATITQNMATQDFQAVTLARTTMTASDTLTYVPGSGQVLFLYNTTASPIVVTITGSGATTMAPAGFGGTISLSAGKAITVPASGSVFLALDDISAYLVGTVTLTGGSGITAHLYV